jgi:hypothetical protein
VHAQVALLAAELRARQAAGVLEFALPAGAAVAYPRLRGELWVGGAYVRLFLKTPGFPLRSPAAFADGLIERCGPGAQDTTAACSRAPACMPTPRCALAHGASRLTRPL